MTVREVEALLFPLLHEGNLCVKGKIPNVSKQGIWYPCQGEDRDVVDFIVLQRPDGPQILTRDSVVALDIISRPGHPEQVAELSPLLVTDPLYFEERGYVSSKGWNHYAWLRKK